MNRRSFLESMLAAGVASMALPSALTYSRIWRPSKLIIEPADWRQTARYSGVASDEYEKALREATQKAFVNAFFYGRVDHAYVQDDPAGGKTSYAYPDPARILKQC